jgi:4-amino-4-deoxy-L-arabinose transferase-like glycosyltransferase
VKARQGLLVVVALSLALDAWGLRWGLPSEYGWAPDELLPQDVDAAVAQRFAHGWHTKYPPLHFAALAAWTVPVRGAARWLRWDAAAQHDARMTAARLLSLAMAAGVLVALYLCGRELGDAWAGVLAAALVACSVPFVYYAKVANLDVPYLFWFTLSLLFFLRALRRGRTHDLVLLALSAAAAVATKDQAFALYVLTVPVLVWELRRLGAGDAPAALPVGRALLLLGATGLMAYLALSGLVISPAGWLAHVQLIAGPASAEFRMFGRGLFGRTELLWQTVRHLRFAMGGPALLAALAGIGLAVRDRARQRRLLLLLVPIVSYVVFFLLVVLYVYDRFLLPVAVVFALFGGYALARAARSPSRPARAAVPVVLVLALARALSVDVLLATDSRYAVEQWLRREVGPGPLVAAVGPLEYLPRMGGLRWRRLGPSAARLAQVEPDVIVLNADYARRADQGTGERAFYDALDDGSLGYVTVRSGRTDSRWCLLDTDALRREGRGHIWSNLDKVDPEIRVYRRARGTSGHVELGGARSAATSEGGFRGGRELPP